MANQKSKTIFPKEKKISLEKQVAQLRLDIEWLQRQIDDLKWKKNNKGH